MTFYPSATRPAAFTRTKPLLARVTDMTMQLATLYGLAGYFFWATAITDLFG